MDGTRMVVGAGFSYVDRPAAKRASSEKGKEHKHHHHHHHGKTTNKSRSKSDDVDDNSDWDADIDDIEDEDEPKKQFYPSLEGLSLEETKPKHVEPAKPVCVDGIRSDWEEIRDNPFSILTKYAPDENEAIKYRKIVRALTQQPFDMTELKKQAWGGIVPAIRPLVWKILVGYLPVNADTRTLVLQRKRKEYQTGVKQLFTGDKDKAIWHQIKIDVPRTNSKSKLFGSDATHRSLERILYLWAVHHPASGYVQGINDLVTPFFEVFLSEYVGKSTKMDDFDPAKLPESALSSVEADTYWCLTKMLDTIQDNYIHDQPGIIRQIKQLKELITRDEPELARHFQEQNLDFIQFAFRWMNCMLMREFDLPLIIRMWDTYLSNFPDGFSVFHVYVCCSFLRRFAPQLLGMEFQDIIMFLQDSSKTKGWTEDDIKMMLSEAYVWQSLYQNATAHLK